MLCVPVGGHGGCIVVLDRCFLCDGKYLAFIGVKFHLPCFFSCHKFNQVVLECAVCRCYCMATDEGLLPETIV